MSTKVYMSTRKKTVAKKRAQPIPKTAVTRPAPRKKATKKVDKSGGAISGIGEMAGNALGSALGGPAGGGIGKFLGGKLGHLIETVTGFGDYQVESNSILDGGMGVPQIENSLNKGSTIVRHREFIGNVLSTVSFTVQSYLIQPGLNSTFPWLAQMANSYEQYRLRGMLFEYVSTSSDALLSAATSTALGTVIMMTDYDVADAPPTSKRQMLNAEFACSTKPSLTAIHPIECARKLSAQDILYTRGAIAVPTNFDQRLYDFARFNIATEGMQAAGGVLGELWVTYEIELLKPQFAFFGQADHFRTSTITAARPLGTVQGSNIGSGGTIGGVINGAGTAYSFPQNISSGKWYFEYVVVGAGAPNVLSPVVTYVNAVSLAIWTNNQFTAVNAPLPAVAANQTTYMVSGTFIITAENAALTFGVAGVPPGATMYGDLWVIRLPDSIDV